MEVMAGGWRCEAWRVVTGQCGVSTASHAACEHGHVIAAVGRIWLECGSDREFQANSLATDGFQELVSAPAGRSLSSLPLLLASSRTYKCPLSRTSNRCCPVALLPTPYTAAYPFPVRRLYRRRRHTLGPPPRPPGHYERTHPPAARHRGGSSVSLILNVAGAYLTALRTRPYPRVNLPYSLFFANPAWRPRCFLWLHAVRRLRHS